MGLSCNGICVSLCRFPYQIEWTQDTYLHAIGHSPPFSHFGIRSHLLHIALEVRADVLHSSEQGAVIVEEYGVLMA
jgi:hypothetical protein